VPIKYVPEGLHLVTYKISECANWEKYLKKKTFHIYFELNVNKGNNKITEHRAIFQRESQNS